MLSADVTIEDTTPHVLSMQQAVVADGLEKVEAVGFHYDKDLIYYSDTDRDVIYRSSSTGEQQKELTVQTRLARNSLWYFTLLFYVEINLYILFAWMQFIKQLVRNILFYTADSGF